MRLRFQRAPWFCLAFPVLLAAEGPGMTVDELKDRIRGGWSGQMIGVVYGAPAEHRWLGVRVPGALPDWSDRELAKALSQDDLYIDVLFAGLLDQQGWGVGTEAFGEVLRDAQRPLAHGNLAARRLLRRGIPGSKTGTPEWNAHWEDIDAQISADFAGLMSPRLPRAAQEYARRAGAVIGSGEGLLGAVFIACLYSAAFGESRPEAVVRAGLACLPPESRYYRFISRTIELWGKQRLEWTGAWDALVEETAAADRCPTGALRPFNIDAPFSGALVALALLYGHGDFDRTLELAVRAAYDADCTASSAAGVLGTMLGYSRIPRQWTAGFAAIEQTPFTYTGRTLDQVVSASLRLAIGNLERHGAPAAGGRVHWPGQKPDTLRIPLGPADRPAERISAADARWQWTGPWETSYHAVKYTPVQTRATAKAGAEASITFRGTGAAITGSLLSTGGKADVYLDGVLDRTLDVCSDEKADRLGEAVWHRLSLPAGEHHLRLVVRGEPHPPCADSRVAIDDLLVFTGGGR